MLSIFHSVQGAGIFWNVLEEVLPVEHLWIQEAALKVNGFFFVCVIHDVEVAHLILVSRAEGNKNSKLSQNDGSEKRCV